MAVVRSYDAVVLMCTATGEDLPPCDAPCYPEYCISLRCAGCTYLKETWIDSSENLVECIVENEDEGYFVREG